MPLPSVNPTTTKAWKKLTQHFSAIKNVKMQELFEKDGARATRMAITWDDFYVDFSKNRITDETLSLLLRLANEVNLKDAIAQQFQGEKINETEGRAVLHTALRDFKNLKPEVAKTLQQMKSFSESISNGDWKGYTGKPIKSIVNIGVGGSHLGPDMVNEALQFYRNHLEVHYISNVDGDHVQETLKKLDRETTLFIVVSKSFTTLETLTNATTVRNWFLETTTEESISKHFVAVSANETAVTNFGITTTNLFPMWDWVGGRFSLWSTVGLSICCAIGYKNFEALLKGAHSMDIHFKETKFEGNIPVILALLSVWYTNFFESETEAVIPYSHYLEKLIPYLQQAVMESNGKSIDRNGNPIDYQTSAIIWGSTGTNGQHAFFQLLHQGTKLIPTDFIAFAASLHGNKTHQDKLSANCLAQTEALLMGTFGDTVENSFKRFDGNKPSNTILIKKLTPRSLGSLIAMYEHKLFVQGIVWNIFSYDQWGVELGKTLAKNTLSALEQKNTSVIKNSSTQRLLDRY
ncbi:glucose-6-phosphate isomerase [Ulvibacter sp. MAR_2010_11]|uniref:glucose-6-phosphate isomerase n=1 Tax=Ulvibacter sp. MAR_2010_11 TaxID=1250229 RepID=UPI000C2BF2BB|nr:glucose-6-phosphate isomerase [Ulvibacter sp. MAR_2010_11]PKA84440.1 glucose-6-phosphate isomerase [Ulvibacter sp. MAR_2010_11]